MKVYNNFFKNFCSYYNFTDEQTEALSSTAQKIDSTPHLSEGYEKIRKYYMFSKKKTISKAMERLSKLIENTDINVYTINEVFSITCCELLLKRYKKAGIDEQIFWDTMADIKYKMIECIDNYHVVGNAVLWWYDKFYTIERFALGRFQYEIEPFPVDFVSKTGFEIKKGTPCVNFHIPSSETPMTDEFRLDSYKKAYEFFKDIHKDGILILKCCSWLLDPIHYEILSEKSNIRKFMDDFEYYHQYPVENFPNGWRIFTDSWEGPKEDLYEKTSLQKAYKKWLLAGNGTNIGCGVILFDGEKILK